MPEQTAPYGKDVYETWHHTCEGSRGQHTITFNRERKEIEKNWELHVDCDGGSDESGDDIFFQVYVSITFCPFCGIHLSEEEAKKMEKT